MFGVLLAESIFAAVPHRHIILFRSRMNLKIKRNFFIHGSIHVSIQRVRFHRAKYSRKYSRKYSACAISSRQIFIIVSQHIPDKRFQMVRYYGWYSNKMRGQRRKRAEEKIANESAATAEQRCGAGTSAANSSSNRGSTIRFRTMTVIHRFGKCDKRDLKNRVVVALDFLPMRTPLRAGERAETTPRRERRLLNVARHFQFSTAVLHSTHGTAASQWICLALARDT